VGELSGDAAHAVQQLESAFGDVNGVQTEFRIGPVLRSC
jgi:hypothetical protein